MNDGSWDQIIQEVIDNTSEDGPYHPYYDGHLQFIADDDEECAKLYREDNTDDK